MPDSANEASQPPPSSNSRRTLSRRIEEASLNAWPAVHQVLLDGWLLRFSSGFTKRANSIIPLYPSLQPSIEKIRYCENLYAREKLQTIFRLTSIDDQGSLDETLARRGYGLLDPTSVLAIDLAQRREDASRKPDAFHVLSLQDWLKVYCEITGMPEGASRLHALLLKSIRTDAVFGARYAGAEVAACGLAVIEHDLVGLFDVVTRPERRREGHANALVEALLQRGADDGAKHGYLQVMDDNGPALALYRKLGFEHLYRYWYRAKSPRRAVR